MGIPRGSFQTASVTATWEQVVPQTSARDSILLSNPTAEPIFLSFGVEGTGTNGIYLPESSPPLQLYRRDWANLIEGPIYGCVASGTATLVFLEVLS